VEIAVFVTDETLECGLALTRESGDVTIVRPEELQLELEVTPPYLTRSYACYRALREREVDVAVFPDRGGDAYCAARARETGTGLSATRVVVDCVAPTLRAVEVGRRPFLSKNVLGTAVAERLALELADGYLCANPELDEWLRAARWRLPPRLDAPLAATRVRGDVTPARERPLVSVVVPYHERTQYLPFCLDGLAQQTYAPLEVIVADDGSTSEGARVQLAEIEGRSWPWQLRVVRLPRGGPEQARNGGWRSASGELVTFIDDDDVPFDEMVETLWRAREHSGADLAVGGGRFFRADGPPTPRRGDVVRIPLCEPHELGLISNQYGGPVVLWPRRLLETLGGFTESLVEDWVLLARASLHGARATSPPDPVFWYRQTGSGRHSRDSAAVRDAGIPQLADVFAGRLPDDLKLLPLLAAGAYAELERRGRANRPRSARSAFRSVVRRIARR
jgi:GT2 family glycosyltransferase